MRRNGYFAKFYHSLQVDLGARRLCADCAHAQVVRILVKSVNREVAAGSIGCALTVLSGCQRAVLLESYIERAKLNRE
jgi:hypothetical protein